MTDRAGVVEQEMTDSHRVVEAEEDDDDAFTEIIRVPTTRLLKRSDSFYEPGAVTTTL